MEIIMELAIKYPAIASVLMLMGVLRAVFKPLMSLLHAYVEATPSEKDNELLKKIMDSKAYSVIQYILDYTASIKLPKKK